MVSEVCDQELDARGLRCPLPLLRAKQALNGLASGQRLSVLTTDPASLRDFAAYCRQAGHELQESAEPVPGEYRLVLRKA